MKTILVVLVVALGFTGYRVADLERQRYAMMTGACRYDAVDFMWMDCLKTVEPRTSFWANLYFGIID